MTKPSPGKKSSPNEKGSSSDSAAGLQQPPGSSKGFWVAGAFVPHVQPPGLRFEDDVLTCAQCGGRSFLVAKDYHGESVAICMAEDCNARSVLE